MSSDPLFRVEVRTVAVTLRCRSNEVFEARLAHVGPESGLELVRSTLAGPERFLAVVDPLTGEAKLVSKMHLYVVEVSDAAAGIEAPQLGGTTTSRVRVRLVDATTLAGDLLINGPAGRTRVSDELNRDSGFVELALLGRVAFVHRDAIVTVWDDEA